MKIPLMLSVILMLFSCVRTKKEQETTAHIPAAKKFEVSEVIQASGYTYLKVQENSEEKWMAVTKMDVSNGDVLFYDEALQMTNFHSKDLNRTFDVIYFVNQVSETQIFSHPAAGMHGMGGMNSGTHQGKMDTGKKTSIDLDKSDREITVAQIYQDKAKYSGQEIEIRGIVVKVNREILGKNWVHIQDGTDSNGNFDLTITTMDLAEVNDEVLVKGKITLDKDFGSGYFYNVIMEDAVLEQNLRQ